MAPHAEDQDGYSLPINNGEVPHEIGVEKKTANERMVDWPRPPVFEDKYKERDYLKGKLAAAFRIFGKYGFDEGVAGHITLRDPVDPHCFWVNPFGVAFSMINKSDLIVCRPRRHSTQTSAARRCGDANEISPCLASKPRRQGHRRRRMPSPQHRSVHDPLGHPQGATRRHLRRTQPFDLRANMVFFGPEN